MNFIKNTLSKLTGNTSFSLNSTIKKISISAVAIASLTIGSQTLANNEDITTIYYVYFNGEYIGNVSDKNVVENLINEKLGQVKESYDRLDLSIGSQVTYVPEQVFSHASKTNNSEVMEQLEERLAVQADAASIVIDGEPVAYVETSEIANKVIKELKLQYVSKKQLAEVEKRNNQTKASLPQLKKGKSRILDVRLSKEITVQQDKVNPKKILSLDEAVKFLSKGTLEEKKYKVREGDVLGSIASDHDMDLEDLLSLNKGMKEDSVLNIDDEINVTKLEPFVTVIVEREVVKKETIHYKKQVIEDSSMPKGDSTVKQKGKKGKREVAYIVSEVNGVDKKKKELSEKVIKKPVKYIVVKGTKEIPSRGDGSFAWPTVGGYVSSNTGYRWGKMHKGIDIAGPSDRTIKAADNGIVVSAGYDGGYGNKVTVDHQNGYRTVYAHLASIDVSVGETVDQGSKLGVMGSTGDSTGVHLHFELYKNGSLKNPLKYVR